MDDVTPEVDVESHPVSPMLFRVRYQRADWKSSAQRKFATRDEAYGYIAGKLMGSPAEFTPPSNVPSGGPLSPVVWFKFECVGGAVTPLDDPRFDQLDC